jgi:PAS domain S-box-containing protein
MNKSEGSPKARPKPPKSPKSEAKASPLKAHNENYFEAVTRNIPLGAAVVNEDQKIEYLNPKFTEMFGYTLEDLPTIQAWHEKAYPDTTVRDRMNLSWKQELLRGSAPGTIKQEASTIRRLDGSDISVHLRITTMGGGRRLLAYENITDRVRAEVLMLDGWNIYRNLVETVLDWTWEIKTNGVFTYSSPQVTNILGYMPGEVVGKTFFDFMSDKDAKKLKQLLQAKDKKSNISFEFSCQGKNDKTVYLEMSGTPLFARSGELIGFRGINRDITIRRTLEAELRASHEKLKALTAKLEDVREEERTHISRELHDELGQVLTGLKIDLTWIAKRIPEEQRPLLDKANAMRGQIDSIIEYIRRIATQLRPKLLDDFGFVEAIEWLISDFRERTAIRCRFRSNLQHMNIDPKASTILFRLIQETLTNIMRHSGASSVSINMKKTAAQLIIEVKDNGVGINESDMKASRSLGILGMRERVSILNGTLKIEGAPGKGTKIKISIPASEVAESE